MLAWFRARSSRIATLAMASLLALGVSAVSPHVDDCHDEGCLGIAVQHDASAHRFVAPASDTDVSHLHCLVCHWVRSFRPRTEARVQFIADAGTQKTFDSELFAFDVTAPTSLPLLRAPPAPPAL
jgi:hypothetical protein